MMSQEDLVKFESLCRSIYGQVESERKEAERQLHMFQKLENYPKLIMIFDASADPHALFFAASQITKMITNNWNSFSAEKKTDLSKFYPDFVHSNARKSVIIIIHKYLYFSLQLSFIINTRFSCASEQLS